MSDALRFRILRGRHSHSSTKDIIHLVKDADIVCVETVGDFAGVQTIRRVANALSTSPEYVELFAKDVEKNINGNLILDIAWAHRGFGKFFLPIDVAYKPTDDMSKFFPFYKLEERLLGIFNTLNDRYAIVRQFLHEECDKIILRDYIVGRQIRDLLAADDGSIWKEVVKEKQFCEIAIVQGYAHDVSRVIKKFLPAASIELIIYNKKSTDNFLSENVGAALLSRQLETPKPEFTDKEIDYYLYQILSQKSRTDIQYTGNMVEAALYVGTKKHEDHYENNRSDNYIKPISAFDDTELKELVNSLLVDALL